MKHEYIGSRWLLIRLAFIAFLLLTACGSQPTLQDRIIGKWSAYLGQVNGLGDIYQAIEFYKDGTVTSRTEVTNFVGDYKFIADDTIRIDWKEQGVVGNSPIQIFKISFDDDKLIMTNDATSRVTEYIRFDAAVKTGISEAEEASMSVATDVAEAAQKPTSVIASKIIGMWRTENRFLTFNTDGVFHSGEISSSGQTIQELEGTYVVLGDNLVQVNITKGDSQVPSASVGETIVLRIDFSPESEELFSLSQLPPPGSGKVAAVFGSFAKVK